MIEKWGKNVDDGGVFGALLTDLSKAFDCVPHDLIIAKLEAYGFHLDALKLFHNYWSSIKQKVKVNYAYRSWKDIFYGVPQGSIFCRLLFSIHLCSLFYFLEYLTKKRISHQCTGNLFITAVLDGLITTLWKQIVTKIIS